MEIFQAIPLTEIIFPAITACSAQEQSISRKPSMSSMTTELS